MNHIKKTFAHLAILLFMVLLGVACSTDWDSHFNAAETTSAYDLLKAQAEYSEFLQLIEQQQLDYLLKGSIVTVFAPVNGTINATGLSEADINRLLRQHIVSGRVTAELGAGKNYYASNGALLSFDASFSQVNGTRITAQGTQKEGSIIYKLASSMSSISSETLYEFLKKNKATYSYIFSLYDKVTFDEKASVKYVDENGKMVYDSVFLAKSTSLDPYITNSEYSTVILFTDKQMDDAINAYLPDVGTAIKSTAGIKQGLITQTFIQNMFKGSETVPSNTETWVAVNGTSQTINPAKLNSKTEVMQNVNVLKYEDLSSNVADNYFSLLIQTDVYTLSGNEGASGGTNAHEVIAVPQFAKGNGFARRIYPSSTAGNSHAFFTIGGVQKGVFVPALNGVDYKVSICVSLTRSMKCILWVYDTGTADKRIFLTNDANFDASNNFVNNTLDGPMRVIEFPVQKLYTRVGNNAPQFKFHTDYRNMTVATFPPINGVVPTSVAQTGIVIDYVEFVPVLH